VVGSDAALRDIWFGRVWRANAARVLEDSDELVALWLPVGAPAKFPVDTAGAEVRIPNAHPVLADRSGRRDALALLRPHRRHSIWLFWTADGAFDHWYVNFERWLGRSAVGYDTVDEKLDLILGADGAIRWKDEDELEHAAELGLVDAVAIRAEAERVIRDWPFPTGWEDFRADPAWTLPRLPEGWDVVDEAPGSDPHEEL